MKLIVFYPESQASKNELARRVAHSHAEHATKMVQQCRCTSTQKQQLMDAAIAAIASQDKLELEA